ncbi:uncharacterized protein [Zea mays]|uniref:uncharacterized protein n=1 Tax=Zea mays TaxID=4577 RepID=UPI0009AAB220|nr:uncharacterized protein LOC103655282 [Zea mays]|eukprot:XP_020407657.1 uncharacterized protein LOC103655282 [Zea mays]
MSASEKTLFCEVLKGVKFPDGYASDIRNNVDVKEKKLVGLMSHDNHVLIQYLLPLAVRRILPEIVSAALIRTRTLAASTNGPTLRSRTERDIVDEESENPINDEEQPIGHRNIKKGRGPTLKKNIYSSSGGPKICITLNEYGQLVGRNSKEFGNFIGTLVRKNIPVSCEDWRLVDSKKKFELWTKVKEYYEVDESGIDYVITSAAKKWREFKADLKNKYFDETLSFEELIAKRDERVKESDWEWLITYWMSPEAEVRTNRGKDNRSKLTMSHAAGSKSYARVGHELVKKIIITSLYNH